MRSVKECKYCRLPQRGGLTGKNYCVCLDKDKMKEIKGKVKLNCSVCDEPLFDKDSLERYFVRGNYCAKCNEKASNIIHKS
jgi:hypothetical protein